MSDGFQILLVDDDPHIQQLITHYLSDFDFDLEIAADGYEAMEQIGNNNFDLIILDYSLPYFNGLKILKKIKNNSKLKNTPVFILTETSDKDRVREFIKNGATNYLVKPPNRKDFLQRVAKVLLKSMID